jgi:hypothetical protein
LRILPLFPPLLYISYTNKLVSEPHQNGHYDQWLLRMNAIIGAHGLWSIVENDVEEPEDDSRLTIAELNALQKRNGDQTALSIIHQGLDDDMFKKITNETSFKDA